MLLTDLFNSLTARKISAAKHSGQEEQRVKLFPVRVIAIVKETDRNHALLRLDGREILARIDIPVKRGEYLLLGLKGFLEGKTCFQVLQRSLQPIMPEEETLLSKPLLVHYLEKGEPVPIVIKYYLEPEDEKNSKENDFEVPHKRKKFDFMIETENLGLVVLSIERIKNRYLGKILVESQESKVILESKLKGLNNVLAAAAKELNLHFEVSNCEIMPAAVTHEKKMLFEGSFVLDRKV